MSKRQYEDFLVDRFRHWALKNLRFGERIHFRSPDDANSLLLHQAFVKQANAEQLVYTPKGAKSLPYLEIGSYKVFPVLHAKPGFGFTENYISTLRDIVSAPQGQLKNGVLLVIHNSSLDTLNNSSRNLCLAEHDVWNPAVIRDALKEMIDSDAPGRAVSECLLNHQFKSILQDGATMFGFRDLFNAVQDGRIDFTELNLLNDSAMTTWEDDEKQIDKRISENKKLKEKIENLVDQYPSELKEKLQELDFGEAFVKQHFPDGDLESWRGTLDYGQCQKEQEKNSENLLELESETIEFGHKSYQRSKGETEEKGETGSGARERYFIIEIPATDNQFKLNVSFVNGQIKDNQVKVKAPAGSVLVTVNRRSSKRNILEITGAFNGTPSYFSVDLKRSKPKENFNYRVLLLPADSFYVAGFASSFVLKPAQKKIILQTDSTRLQLAGNGPAVDMTDNEQEFDNQSVGSINYEQLVNATDRLSFKVRSGEHVLQFDVEGAASSDSLVLPLLLDTKLHARLFNDDFFGVFNKDKGKVALDGKELKPRTEHRRLLIAETNLLQQQLLSDTVGTRQAISLTDLQQPYPQLYADYSELFDYLNTKRTLLSLVSWSDAVTMVVKRIIDHYLAALGQIQTTRLLTASEQLLINIGFADIDGKEYLTPYHPLNLAYFASLTEAMKLDESRSFKTLPQPTIRRLNAEGLLPFNWHSHYDFSYSQVVKDNPMWLAVVPSKQTQLDYIQHLVKHKTNEFVEAFTTLFACGDKDTLLINSINNGHNKELLLGLVEFFKKRKPEQANRIHINLYDAELQHTYFDKVADSETFDELKQLCGLTADKEDADATVDMIRRRITYSKFNLPQQGKSFRYAHLSFVRNNSPVLASPVDIKAEPTGIACHGLLAGETSYSEQQDYFTTSGLMNIEVENKPQLQVMEKYSALSKAAWLGEKYNNASSLALKVSSQLQQLLDAVYEDSIWTVIIDPKVTLKFFKSQKDVVLIHYSDNYTNSANYDAITVTKRRDFYDQILAQGTKGLIDEFNAFNGEWLLKMLTLPSNERKEKKSVIGAYKYINCLLFHSDITWVPLSVAEMLRVAGNIGLKMSDADFSRYSQGIRQGAISDDVLFVGFKDQQMYLLPLEVKVGKKQKHDKGVRQAKELKRYLVEQLFGRDDLAGHLYRGLFVRQVFMQVDKYELYRVYPQEYFSALKAKREWWLQGDYQLADIAGYPQGFVLAFIEGDFITEQFYLEQDILQIRLPGAYQSQFISTPLQNLLSNCTSQALGFIDEQYILNGATTAVAIEWTQSADEDNGQEDDEPTLTESSNVEYLPEVEYVPTTLNNEEIKLVAEEPQNLNKLAPQDSLKVLIGNNVVNHEEVLWEPTNTNRFLNAHMGIVGVSGSGKTQCTKSVLAQLYRNQHNNVEAKEIGILVFDYKEDYVDAAFKQITKAKSYNLHKLPYNPLSLFGDTPMLPVLTARGFAETMAKAFGLGTKQQLKLRKLIADAYELAGIQKSDPSTWHRPAPTIADVWALFEQSEPVEDSLYAALETLNELEIFEPDVDKCGSLYDLIDGVAIIELGKGYSDELKNLVVALTLDLFYAQMQKSGKPKVDGDFRQISKFVLVDEADNFMKQNFVSLRKILNESREYGVGIILSTQEITHFKTAENDYSSSIRTWVVHEVPAISSKDIKALFNKDDKNEQDQLMKAIRELKKHHSLFVVGGTSITRIRDKAFWELLEYTSELFNE